MINIQVLRLQDPGNQPPYLLPGQIAVNMPDQVIFVGNSTDFKSPYDGPTVPGVPGQGWFSAPLNPESLEYLYLVSPNFYGQAPSDDDYLKWDATLGHLVWTSSSGSSAAIYVTNNAAVAAAPGASVSSKITSALGLTPDAGDTVIVSGNPGDLYEGYYGFTGGAWQFASHYAFPTAAQVSYDNTASGLTATNVQSALTEVAQIALAALPLAGGTMLGYITFLDGQPVDAGTF
jgi:hypothetical protein